MISVKAKVYLNTDEVAAKLKSSATNSLAKCALLVEAEAKRLLSKGGKQLGTAQFGDKKVPVKYTPSDVGMPPHLRTGNLRSSIRTEKTEVGSYVVGPSKMALYGRIHEFGGHINVTAKMRMWLGMNLGIWMKLGSTVHIPPRPFMKPALDNCLQKFPDLFKNIPLGGNV